MIPSRTQRRPLLPDVAGGPEGSESTLTVLVALAANVLIAVAKSVAAVITGSASMVAESAHSWADAGNELLLLAAHRRGAKGADPAHPFGYGREAYVWSLFAAFGLFAAGAAVSITHGVQELLHPQPGEELTAAYVVLAIAFVLEGASFTQAIRQARSEARTVDRDLVDHVVRTSDPVLRAVVAEDAAALTGLVIAAVALVAQDITGSAVPDALGSIVVGILLTVVALLLIEQNRRFLVGREPDPRLWDAVLQGLLDDPEVERVTYLRLEFVGPRVISVVGNVDLTGDETEQHVAVRLRDLEARLDASPVVAGSVLSLAAPDEPSILPGSSAA